MAVYFLRVKIFSRSRGSRATKAAAYRAGERIHDERSGDGYNYSHRQDVVAKDIVLPSQLAGRTELNWARNRSALWNAAEHSDRRNARLAREVLVCLPPELTAAQRTNLVKRFSQELADKYQNAVDYAVHLPRASADERHHHAHMLMTARQVTANGLGARTTLELGGRERHARGLRPSIEDLLFIRERWAQVTNEALRDAGLTARIDHRTYKAQGIDREPNPMMPDNIRYQEKLSGRSNPAADDIRARHRERIEARLKGSDALARVIERQKVEARQRAIEKAERNASLPKKIARGALTREELLQKRREYVSANRETINRNNRKWRVANAAEVNRRRNERRKANPEEQNRKTREWREANAAQFSRKAREWRQANAAKISLQHRERYRARVAQAAAKASSVQENPLQQMKAKTLTQNLRRASLKNSSPAATTDKSVKNWLEFRERQKQLPADDSVNKWLAYRESQKHAEASLTVRRNCADILQAKASGRNENQGIAKNRNRGRGKDLGL
ncbi:MAG TPA: MobA/MobL family protein [Steroidobacteraceae bacterium]